MCLIIYKPQNSIISKADLRSAWNNNPDGLGLAYFDQNMIKVHKGIMTFKDAYKLISNLKNKELVIHFRFATHGSILPENTHPFEIHHNIDVSKKCLDPKSILFHNGVIQGFGSNTLSDTCHFTTSILSKIEALEDRFNLLESVGSKYIVMDLDSNLIQLIGKFEDYKGLKVSNLYSLQRDYFWTRSKGNTSKYFDKYSFMDQNYDPYTDVIDYPTQDDFKKILNKK